MGMRSVDPGAKPRQPPAGPKRGTADQAQVSAIHLCLVTPEYPPAYQGGIATYSAHLAQIFYEAGQRVTVLTSVAAEDDRRDAAGARVVRLDAAVRQRLTELAPVFGPQAPQAARAAAFGLAVRDWLLAHREAEAVDVVEAAEYGGAAAFLVAQALPPLVVTSHGSTGQVQFHTAGTHLGRSHQYLASLELAAMSTADAVACYGRRNREDWEIYLGRPVRYVIPPFVPIPVGAALRPPETGAILGIAVGRLNNWKGALEAAEALRICRRQGLDISVLWVGRDQPAPREAIASMRDHLEQKYPELWGSSFLWRESLDPAQTRAAQAAADFALVPSRWDTFNFTAPEAMSVGTPVIVSAGAGASDICTEGVDALVVTPGDAAALAVAMERMADPELRRELGTAGKATVARELAAEKVVESRLQVYSEAIERHDKRLRLGHTSSLMDAFASHWLEISELIGGSKAAERLPSRLLFREAARRVRRQPIHRLLTQLPLRFGTKKGRT